MPAPRSATSIATPVGTFFTRSWMSAGAEPDSTAFERRFTRACSSCAGSKRPGASGGGAAGRDAARPPRRPREAGGCVGGRAVELERDLRAQPLDEVGPRHAVEARCGKLRELRVAKDELL